MSASRAAGARDLALGAPAGARRRPRGPGAHRADRASASASASRCCCVAAVDPDDAARRAQRRAAQRPRRPCSSERRRPAHGGRTRCWSPTPTPRSAATTIRGRLLQPEAPRRAGRRPASRALPRAGRDGRLARAAPSCSHSGGRRAAARAAARPGRRHDRRRPGCSARPSSPSTRAASDLADGAAAASGASTTSASDATPSRSTRCCSLLVVIIFVVLLLPVAVLRRRRGALRRRAPRPAAGRAAAGRRRPARWPAGSPPARRWSARCSGCVARRASLPGRARSSSDAVSLLGHQRLPAPTSRPTPLLGAAGRRSACRPRRCVVTLLALRARRRRAARRRPARRGRAPRAGCGGGCCCRVGRARAARARWPARAADDGELNELRVGVGVIAAAVGVAALLPWLVERVVAPARRGPVAWQLAVRRLQLDSGGPARAVSGITVAVAGAIALQMLFAGIQDEFKKDTGADLAARDALRRARRTASVARPRPARGARCGARRRRPLAARGALAVRHRPRPGAAGVEA